MTDEHEHAMNVWREADRAGEDAYVEAVETGTTAVEAHEAGNQAAAAVIAADRAGLVAEVERLRAITSKLADYAGHDEDCQIMTRGVWSDPIPCTCGYSEIARAALKDTRND